MHFWIATVGIVLYVLAMWVAGITQGLMWRTFDDAGHLQYPDARALCGHAAPAAVACDVREELGRGIRATVAGHDVVVGAPP